MSSDLPTGPGLEDDGEPLSDRVVSALQRRIISGEIPIGAWLRHSTIAEEFGISRTPVREALRILAARGVVTIVPHRGAQVNGQSGQDIRDIGEVRAELEGLAASLAADRMDDEQLHQMTGAWQRFAEGLDEPAPGDGDQATEWVRSNDAFHSVILEASGNKFLHVAINELRRRLPHNLSYGAYEGNSRMLAKNLEEHRAIAEAIVAQDKETARALMAAHIRASNDATARWVEQNSTS